MKQRSVMGHKFSEVPRAEIPRSSFDRSHGLKTTFDAGLLIPIFLDEALPGDTFNLKLTAFSRLATPIFPLMDNMVMDTHFFAVPHRLLWDNWEKFCGSQVNPGDSVSFNIPNVAANTWPELSIGDYFGLPLGNAVSPSALWFRAYNLIYNEWFRDENLVDSVATNVTSDGPDAESDYVLLRRGKRHDYFTSCLPFPQKGVAVALPLGTRADVVYTTGDNTILGVKEVSTSTYRRMDTAGAVLSSEFAGAVAADGEMYADLSSATAATINQIREAFQIQKLLERDARGGTRYTEIVKAHFGVSSPDSRLQRPEYLGGGSSPVQISQVAQTSSTDVTTPQGSLAAFGMVSLHGHGFTKSFTEHCVLLGLVSVRADLTYWQGLNRMWSRLTRFDYYWPALSHIGEQSVLNKEIFFGNVAADDLVFGYQERYAEYRYKPSQITGLFRSSATGSLDSWHLAQDFSVLPVLDFGFIAENPPVDRVIAVPAEPHFLFDSFFDLRCARPMPLFGVPGMIDHF